MVIKDENNAYSGEDSSIRLFVGNDDVQTIQIKEIKLENYGNGANYDSLVEDFHKEILYNGQPESAIWRREALERIEEVRRADITGRVIDSDGFSF